MEHTRPERLTPRALAAVARRLTRADSAHDDDRWLLQAIADNTPAAIFVRDLEQRFLFVNRRYRDAFTGGTDVVGRRIDEVFPAPQAADFMQADLRAAQSGGPVEHEIDISQPDGSRRSYLAQRFPAAPRRRRAVRDRLRADRHQRAQGP
jgi:PAS domain S-box-containing protein